MKSLFARPTSKRGLVLLMLGGSLVLHGGLVGIGALFVQPPPSSVAFEWIPSDVDEQGPVAISVSELSPHDVIEPVATPEAIEPSISTPPPASDDVELADPPVPTPHQKTSPKQAIARTNVVRATSPSTSVSIGNGPSAKLPGKSEVVGVAPWITPSPSYPADARRFASGTGATTVRITTDAAGRISNVEIVRSAGNPILDAHTINYVRGHWRGPANATRTTEFIYQLR